MHGRQGADELDAAVAAEQFRHEESGTEPCAVCGGPTVLCCSGCEEVFYCSVNCQQKDWASHRLHCHRRADQVAQQVKSSLAIVPTEPKETPPHKREIVLAGKEHAIKGAEEKREQLRSAAVAAARDRRYMEVLDSAMQAYQMGASESRRKTAGEPDVDLNQLVEALNVRAADSCAWDTNRLLLRDLLLRKPQGHIAARLLDRFGHMVQAIPKLGRRHLNEFRENLQATDHILHILVSADGQSLALKAKLAYDPLYILVPVLEGETKPPWNKKEFANVCNAIHSAAW
ncbi:rft1 [Symbiodinium sp. CCMP2592]|nr:rft1 [Symbiodinium sp. CCMP2592]